MYTGIYKRKIKKNIVEGSARIYDQTQSYDNIAE